MNSKYTEVDVERDLALLQYGHDPEAARNLIEYLFAYVDENGDEEYEPHKEHLLRRYLHHVLGQILQGKSPAVAMGLKRGRGRPQERHDERDLLIACYINVAMRKWGETWLKAKGDAANLFFPDGTGDKAVEAAYREHNYLKEYPDAFFEAVASFFSKPDDPLQNSTLKK